VRESGGEVQHDPVSGDRGASWGDGGEGGGLKEIFAAQSVVSRVLYYMNCVDVQGVTAGG
jgi:hypothetical protein